MSQLAMIFTTQTLIVMKSRRSPPGVAMPRPSEEETRYIVWRILTRKGQNWSLTVLYVPNSLDSGQNDVDELLAAGYHEIMSPGNRLSRHHIVEMIFW